MSSTKIGNFRISEQSEGGVILSLFNTGSYVGISGRKIMPGTPNWRLRTRKWVGYVLNGSSSSGFGLRCDGHVDVPAPLQQAALPKSPCSQALGRELRGGLGCQGAGTDCLRWTLVLEMGAFWERSEPSGKTRAVLLLGHPLNRRAVDLVQCRAKSGSRLPDGI